MTISVKIPCDRLRRMYIDEGKSHEVIAKEFGVGKSSVQRRRVECGIPRREGPSTLQNKNKAKIDKTLLHRLYVAEEKTEKEIANMLGYDKRTIRKHLLLYGIELRKPLSVEKMLPRETLGRYIKEGLTNAEISKITNIEVHQVAKLLKKCGIETRLQYIERVLTKDFLRKEYLERKLSTNEIAGNVGCNVSAVIDRLRRYGIPLRKPSQEQKEWFQFCKVEGQKRRQKMLKILGGRCAICRADVNLHIHHMCYKSGDAIHDNYKKSERYNMELFPLVQKEPWRFKLLCGSCHMVMGGGGDYSEKAMSNLMALLEEMDRMRKIHPTMYEDLIVERESVGRGNHSYP